jgi:hypothetical protein
MRKILRAVIAPSLLMTVLGPLPLAQGAPSSGGYTIRAVCLAPAPRHASCLGLRLLPSSQTPASATPRARALSSRGASRDLGSGAAAAATPALKTLSPKNLLSAYGLSPTSAEPQTIALVDAYDDPNAEADLAVYDKRYELPACTHAEGCFTKINQAGKSAPLPPANGEWSEEIATDIEVAHSLCQNCHILLVEAESDSFPNLEAAEDTAAAEIAAASKPGALEGEISDSWGGEEPQAGSPDSPAYNHPGIVITAAAGDAGYLNWDEYANRETEGSAYFDGPDYPASSPHVIAVGGTSLTVNSTGEWASEKVWNDSSGAGGGGCSAAFTAPSWQTQALGWSTVGCGAKRAVADVSADADPYTGVRVYDSVPEALGTEEEASNKKVPEWMTIGGTSVASPIIASAFALAGGAHGVAYPAATLYGHAGSAGLHDITTGGNGECDAVYSGACGGSLASPLDCGPLFTICNAASGYDGPTGVGTPVGLAPFQPATSGSPGGSGSGGGTSEGSGRSEAEGGAGGGQSGGSTGGGSTGGGPAPVQPGAGSSGSQPSPPAGTESSATPPSTGSSGASHTAVKLSHLSLAPGALAALDRGDPRASKVAFSFVLSIATRVHVTLARLVRVRGHWRWQPVPVSVTIAASAGANHARLSAKRGLIAGHYLLKLAPVRGAARSIAIVIG